MDPKQLSCSNGTCDQGIDCNDGSGCGGYPVDEESLNKFPEFTMLCKSCQHEFKLEVSMFEIDKAVCPSCQSSDLKNIKISFPKDGPGFKENRKFNGTFMGSFN
ncbi:MAG: zinc ribbon domain-containing protein [Desulfitobacterium sp.]|nr:zinc ribbon domain-containing protein [Desulfitobacterium sp.]